MSNATANATTVNTNVRACGLSDHMYILLRMITGIMDVSNRYNDTKLSVYGSSFHTLNVALVDLFGHDKASSILSNVAWGVCETWFDDLLAAIEASNEGPRYSHDCDECQYLGDYHGDDVYQCKGLELIRRFGNEGQEYSSMDVKMVKTLTAMGVLTEWEEILPILK